MINRDENTDEVFKRNMRSAKASLEKAMRNQAAEDIASLKLKKAYRKADILTEDPNQPPSNKPTEGVK